jgi:hypothetical protein
VKKITSELANQVLTTFRLGRSSEQAFFGGTIFPIVREPDGLPHLGLVALTFPQEALGCNAQTNPRLINPKMTSKGFAWPIPVTFCENLCSQAYWDVHMPKFGLAGGLKMPQVITATVSSKVHINGYLNGADYYFDWAILKESDDELRQKLQAASMQSLSSMTPTQRGEHAALMKREMVAYLQALLAERNDLVGEVITAGEWTMKLDQTHTYYAIGMSALLSRLEELFEKHLEIIRYVAKAEAKAGTHTTQDQINAVLSFHRNLRIYVNSYLPNQNAAAQEETTKLLEKIDNVDINDAFEPLRLPGIKAEDETAQELIITEAQLALDNGDEDKCREACSKITQTLDASSHFQALARVYQALCTSTARNIRIGILALALSMIERLDIDTVPAHLNLKGTQVIAANLLASLQAEEAEENAGLICKM